MINKRIKNIVEKLVTVSFNKKGEVLEKQVKESIRTLKMLPNSQAISALSLYHKGIRRELAKTTLEISSPVKLSEAEKKQIARLAGSNQTINEIKVLVDPSLFGGLRIKIGDVVFDDTVRCKIGQLKGAICG